MVSICRRPAIVALSAVAIAAGACRASGGSTAATYARASCPNPIVAGAPEFDLGADFQCGYLTVAENRERPSGRTIRIPPSPV
jgi:hypothetical protein